MGIFGNKNDVKIDGAGNIVVQNSNNSTITINAHDPDVLEKLQQLNNEQIAVIQQIVKEQSDKFTELFKNLIQGTGIQKNLVQGNINATSVRIGDEIHYHYDAAGKLPKELSGNIPFVEQDSLIGRIAEVKALHEMLWDGRQMVVIHGMEGIGKSTLAQYYMHNFWDHYKHIVWVQQVSDDIIPDFARDQALLNNLSISSELEKPAEIFSEIMRKLKTFDEGPCLLIIDNAGITMETHRNNLPKQPLWHVLITSQLHLNGFSLMQTDPLPHDDAMQLFKMHYSRAKLTGEQIAALVRSVEYHTLTIEILAKTSENIDYTFEELSNALALNLDTEIPDMYHSDNTIYRIGTYLSSFFNLSRLEQEEIRVMKYFACMPSAFIGYDLLKELILEDKENKKLPLFLNRLVRKGWLMKHPLNDSYKMHHIIGGVLLMQIPVSLQDVGYLAEQISARLNTDQTKDNPATRFPWIPYGKSLLAVMETQENLLNEDEKKISELQNLLAVALKDIGNPAQAKILLEKVVASDEKNFGPEHHETAVSYSNLAMVLLDLADYEGAKYFMQKSVQSDEKNFGQEHPITANHYANLAIALKYTGEKELAAELYRKVIVSDEKNHGKDHPATAIHYSNLALLLREMNDFEGAKILLEKCTRSMKKNYGEDHPYTAKAGLNLATVLFKLRDVQGAKTELEHAVKVFENNYKKDHPDTAMSYSNLALVLEALGEYEQALELSDKAVEVYQKLLPKGHPYIDTVVKINESIKQKIRDQENMNK